MDSIRNEIAQQRQTREHSLFFFTAMLIHRFLSFIGYSLYAVSLTFTYMQPEASQVLLCVSMGQRPLGSNCVSMWI